MRGNVSNQIRLGLRAAAAGIVFACLLFAAVQPAEALATKDEVTAAQQALIALGYDLGRADGSTGKRTRTAIRRFQHKFGLPMTGALDDATLAALNVHIETPPPEASSADAATPPPADSSSPEPTSAGGVLLTLFVLGGIGIAVWRSVRKPSVASQSKTYLAPTTARAAAPSWTASRPATINLVAPASRRPLAPSERANESRQCWVSANQTVTVGKYNISTGLLYVGPSLSRSDGLGIENCLINPTLAISADTRNDDGAGMPYYPSYSFIEPACRASYLHWLANGKSDADTYVGYVFLYFYGLERRLFIDSGAEEAKTIVDEVRRLRGIYSHNHSFASYSGLLLDAAALKIGSFEPSTALADLRKSSWELPLSLRAEIGACVGRGDGLTANQMLAWYCAHPERRIPPFVAAKCADEFRQLFAARFTKQFPQGLKVTAPKRRLSAVYKAASGSFSVVVEGAHQQLPDITGLTAPLNSVQPIVDGCVAELETYARRLPHKSEKRGGLDVALALPAELANSPTAAPIAALKQYCEKVLRGPVVAVPVADLLNVSTITTASNDKIGKSDIVLLARALERCGFGLEPDPRLGYERIESDDVIALFRLSAGSVSAAPSPQYAAASMLVDLGALVATADGVFAIAELEAIQKSLAADSNLSELERRRLLARTAFRAKKPASLRDFKKLSGQSLEQREGLARFAVSVAAADNRIAVEEVQLLEKLYRALNLPEAQLYSDLQGMGAATGDLARAAMSAGEVKPGVVGADERRRQAIVLDPTRLAQTREETAKVSALLQEVFVDDAPPTPSAAAKSVVSSAGINALPLDGLDPRYAALISVICHRDTISRSEFEDLAREQEVLPDGAIEAINDWAYTKFDQPLLEEGDPISIEGSLLGIVKEAA